jgi:hypothetical protein
MSGSLMRANGRGPLAMTSVLAALAVYGIWTAATYLLEGRLLTLLRPEAVFDRLAYAVVANVFIGVVAVCFVLRGFVRGGGPSPRHFGFRSLGYTSTCVMAGLAVGAVAFLVQRPPSLDPVVLLNGFAQVWVVSAAEILVCWVLLGNTVEASLGRAMSRRASIAGVWVVSAVAFGVYHFAHSPPFNRPAMVGALTAVGLITGAFFIAFRELYGTIVFHNFLGLTGVTRALAESGRLDQFSVVQSPLIVMAVVATGILLAADVLIVRRSRRAPVPG